MSIPSVRKSYGLTLVPGQLSQAPGPTADALRIQTEQLLETVREAPEQHPAGGFKMGKAATERCFLQLTYLLRQLGTPGKMTGPKVGLLERYGAFLSDPGNPPRTESRQPIRVDLRLQALAFVAQNAARAVGVVEGGLALPDASAAQPLTPKQRAAQATLCLKDAKPQTPGLGLGAAFDTIQARVMRSIDFTAT